MSKPSEEQRQAVINLLVADLGFINPDPARLEFLGALVDVAAEAIEQQGAALDYDSVSDRLTCEAYAAWLYRKRAADGGDAGRMPRVAQYALNNAIFRTAAKETGQ